jgi:GAF domain-containing protein
MDNKYKQQPDYDLLVQQVKALGEEENYWLPVLANTSALLMNALPDLNWAGFYLMNRDSLVL